MKFITLAFAAFAAGVSAHTSGTFFSRPSQPTTD